MKKIVLMCGIIISELAFTVITGCTDTGINQPTYSTNDSKNESEQIGEPFDSLLNDQAVAYESLPDSSIFLEIARAYIETRNKQLIKGSEPASSTGIAKSTASTRLIARNKLECTTLINRRIELEQLGEQYTGFRTDVQLIGGHQDGNTVTVTIEESTSFDYMQIHGDEPPETFYQINRIFTFNKSADGQWALDDVALENNEGLLPINEVVEIIPNMSSISTEQSSDISREGQIIDTKMIDGLGKTSATKAYNYSKMVSYATKWAKKYNPNYRKFSQDCTNFISQCMKAGGWGYKTGWYRNSSVWWYNSLNQSWTWAGADNWYHFATGSGRTHIISNVWNVGLADVVQMDFNRDGKIDHSMIVTKVSGSARYLSYHTTATLNRSLSSIKSSYPNARYYAHRT